MEPLLTHEEISTVLEDSIKADVQQFLESWARSMKKEPEFYPKELTKDEWIEQFWAWRVGE